ncbi:hypothetical protein IscW_ISCW002172 [Ixodes scapularis]|uniref:Uncharacterized protein n=1 Tax=Ixodes scapularis TaxID=6945 RepID=B7P9C1_IXOSC|nr:hypothetical protein IscW_ISCW002172 [Ixodes scapularis]|eukprot:XP_002403924.1 hypothetical protein IscW_ISCW002172 [Ixodes scapularis]
MMQLSWCLQSFALIDPYVEYCTKDFKITPKPSCLCGSSCDTSMTRTDRCRSSVAVQNGLMLILP